VLAGPLGWPVAGSIRYPCDGGVQRRAGGGEVVSGVIVVGVSERYRAQHFPIGVEGQGFTDVWEALSDGRLWDRRDPETCGGEQEGVDVEPTVDSSIDAQRFGRGDRDLLDVICQNVTTLDSDADVKCRPTTVARDPQAHTVMCEPHLATHRRVSSSVDDPQESAGWCTERTEFVLL
jgi:hypothetical protein